MSTIFHLCKYYFLSCRLEIIKGQNEGPSLLYFLVCLHPISQLTYSPSLYKIFCNASVARPRCNAMSYRALGKAFDEIWHYIFTLHETDKDRVLHPREYTSINERPGLNRNWLSLFILRAPPGHKWSPSAIFHSLISWKPCWYVPYMLPIFL